MPNKEKKEGRHMSEELSAEEMQVLGEKIESFAAGLSDRERDALAAALWNGETSEVEGFARSVPVARNFVGLKFSAGISKVAFPKIDHKGPVAFKPSPDE